MDAVVKDNSGAITEVRVTAARSADAAKPKAFIHWVSRPATATVRLYNRL